MSAADQVLPQISPPRPVAWLPMSLSALRAAVADRLERVRVAAQLGSMSDRELADIGLTRFDVARVARGEPVGR